MRVSQSQTTPEIPDFMVIRTPSRSLVATLPADSHPHVVDTSDVAQLEQSQCSFDTR